jgi:hypothetical protein
VCSQKLVWSVEIYVWSGKLVWFPRYFLTPSLDVRVSFAYPNSRQVRVRDRA